MTVKNIIPKYGTAGTITDEGFVNPLITVVIEYEEGWLYCGSSGWTKSEKDLDHEQR